MLNRVIAAAGAALMWVAVASPAMADDAGAKQFVDGVASSVLQVVKAGGSKDEQQAKLLAIVDKNIDIDFVAKFVLGKYWRDATPQQQQDYLAAYRPFLKKNYVSRLTKYSGQTYTLGTPHAGSDGDTVVPMEIVDPQGQNVSMLYTVTQGSNGYRISDIVVEGVSLLSTQRSEFNSIAQSKGLDYLIQTLQKRSSAS